MEDFAWPQMGVGLSSGLNFLFQITSSQSIIIQSILGYNIPKLGRTQQRGEQRTMPEKTQTFMFPEINCIKYCPTNARDLDSIFLSPAAKDNSKSVHVHRDHCKVMKILTIT